MFSFKKCANMAIVSTLTIFATSSMQTNTFGAFGGFAIEEDLYNYIRSILPEGSAILEFGSGFGTGELAKHYKMYSVEHDPKWIGKYNSTYIHARFINGWYDVNALMEKLPKEYDLILVDGPYWPEERLGFAHYLELFRTDAIIIFDDVNVETVQKALIITAEKLGRGYQLFKTGQKIVGVIFP